MQQKHGLEIVELDENQKEEWDSRLRKVVEDWLDQAEDAEAPAQEILDRVRELRDHYSETWERQFV